MKLVKNTLQLAMLLSFTALASAEPAKTEAKPYPLKTCLVSGEEFGGAMGPAFVFTHEGQEIKLCCKSCKPKFEKDPAKYLSKLKDAK